MVIDWGGEDQDSVSCLVAYTFQNYDLKDIWRDWWGTNLALGHSKNILKNDSHIWSWLLPRRIHLYYVQDERKCENGCIPHWLGCVHRHHSSECCPGLGFVAHRQRKHYLHFTTPRTDLLTWVNINCLWSVKSAILNSFVCLCSYRGVRQIIREFNQISVKQIHIFVSPDFQNKLKNGIFSDESAALYLNLRLNRKWTSRNTPKIINNSNVA